MPTQELSGRIGNPRDPLVSPLYAGLAGLPPLYIQAWSDETLLDNSRLFADRARQARADVRTAAVDAWQISLRRVVIPSPQGHPRVA